MLAPTPTDTNESQLNDADTLYVIDIEPGAVRENVSIGSSERPCRTKLSVQSTLTAAGWFQFTDMSADAVPLSEPHVSLTDWCASELEPVSVVAFVDVPANAGAAPATTA